MVNSEEFTSRLQKIIDYYGESASSFAEKIGVQRSSISHILSGRNKPSLEFVLRIVDAFAEVDLHWLLFGKGNFPIQDKSEPNRFENKTESPIQQKIDFNNELKVSDKFTNEIRKEKTIDKIVIFYSDGSFKNYQN